MIRPMLLLNLLFFSLSAATTFVSSHVCAKCHPLIYQEYMGSMHRKSSTLNDPVHAAVWAKHPLKAKKRYQCGVCHTPSDTRLISALKAGKAALPHADAIQTNEPIGCAYCHRIQKIEEHKVHNINVIEPEMRRYFAAKGGKTDEKTLKFHTVSSFFGLSKKTEGSPFHTIDYTNPIFADGRMCMGCHSHKRNKLGFAVCETKGNPTKAKKNCIQCHMPKVPGSFSTITHTKTHTFHGFAGLHNATERLAQSVKLEAKPHDDRLIVTIENQADHRLFNHPLRLGRLKVEVTRGDKSFSLDPVDFYTVLGRDGKPSMPWSATEIVKAHTIEANAKTEIELPFPVQKGDRVTVTLGYFIVNPKAAAKLGITDKSLTTFKRLKSQTFAF